MSSLVASDFIKRFYTALDTSRETVASFYLAKQILTDGKALPVILFNGNTIDDGTAMQALFKEKMPDSHHEVQSYDCHVLNASIVPPDYQINPEVETGRNMVLLITISGTVRYGDTSATFLPERKGFSESIILVPDPGKANVKLGLSSENWLIRSQNFRLVV